ncbi:MAG: KH domain-containing protein [Victivallales bacterium]|nr:KH domain-containing protein [Victivallales bacterium]
MTEETIERAPKILGTMLDYLGLDASVKAEDKNGVIMLTVFSEDAGRIIGKKGIALHSLQLLVNRVVSKGDKDSPRVLIDVDGYRRPERSSRREGGESVERGADRDRRGPRRRNDDRRREPQEHSSSPDKDEQIRQKALDAAKEVKRWGEPVTLPPMNAKDRRIVHLALEDNTEISAESVSGENGNENFKSIVLTLK